MTRVYFARELDTAASWWRIYRRDGVTLGFTTHDRDLWFDGILHRAAPGMLPAAIRRTRSLSDDETEVEGALTHDTIRHEDIAAGRFDGARIEAGVIDWQDLVSASLYSGSIESIREDASAFSAALRSAKADLDRDPVPQTSPTCRARFCGPGCTLSAQAYTRRARLVDIDYETNQLSFALEDPRPYLTGSLRFLEGPQSGITMRIVAIDGERFVVDTLLNAANQPGQRAVLLEGCDHTLASCAQRFDNAINFQGEPHLPGNDLLASYPQPR